MSLPVNTIHQYSHISKTLWNVLLLVELVYAIHPAEWTYFPQFLFLLHFHFQHLKKFFLHYSFIHPMKRSWEEVVTKKIMWR